MTNDNKLEEINFRYYKSNHFRVVLAEGCYGGVSPRGLIRSTFYTERSALPDTSTLRLENGQPTGETFGPQDGKMVREMEVEVVMDLNASLAYYVWLGEKIETLRTNLGLSEEAIQNTISQLKPQR